MHVMHRLAGEIRIEAFQKTRRRPITDVASAEAWRAFDRLWMERA